MRKITLILLLFISITSSSKANEVKDTITIAYTRAAPFIITDNTELDGISIWIWKKIAAELDVEYQLVEMGFRDILSGLEDGTVDLSINPLTVTSERSKRMNFTYPFYASNATVAIQKSTFFRQFLQFLRTFLSVSFLSGILGWIFIIFFFGFIIWLFERKKNPEHFREDWSGIWDGLWWSVVTMTTVGYGDKSPKSNGGKMVALIWMFSGLLFISGLTASVASSLTINQLSWNSKSITDFKERKSGTIQSTGTEDYLQHHFFKKIVPYSGLTEGLNGLLNNEVDAFLYDEPILKYRIANEDAFQSLEILPIRFDLQFYAFAFSDQHDALNKAVSQKILEYTESMEWRILLAEYDLTEL